jgi:hypothetical protein
MQANSVTFWSVAAVLHRIGSTSAVSIDIRASSCRELLNRSPSLEGWGLVLFVFIVHSTVSRQCTEV